VFNALARLSDERQAAGAPDEPAVTSDPELQQPSQQADADLSPLDQALTRADTDDASDTGGATEEPISEAALEFDPETTDVGAVFVEPPPNPQWTAATGSFKAMRAASQSGEPQVDVEIDAAFLADMLREAAPESEPQHSDSQPSVAPPTEPAPQSVQPPPATAAPARTSRDPTAEPEALSPPSVAEPAPATESARAAARHVSTHMRPPAEASVRRRVTAAHERSPRTHDAFALQLPEEDTWAPLENAADEITAADTSARNVLARLDSRTWAAGAALALLVLVAQIVNHYRDELAASPHLGRPVTALYGSLGVQLVPQWDLRAYDVRQLGASADTAGSGVITVRASIKNASRKAQPLPLLRVTLQDRFGNRIAARDVAPRFYVPHTIPESSYLAGGQRIDAEMGFVDPGTNAVGFEIDACLPAGGGGVTCANDLAAR